MYMENSLPNFSTFSLNLKGVLKEFDRPQIMGILNVTPDSFYSVSRLMEPQAIERRVNQIIEEGADFIDIGGYSSRPGAIEVSEEEELRRLRLGIKIIRGISKEIPVSVDTFRANVARAAVEEYGADIINDISGGLLDPMMEKVVEELGCPYILMHMRGNPETMQTMTDYSSYGGVIPGVVNELWDRVERLSYKGVADIIIDPGFGFAKSVEQNYELLRNLPLVKNAFARPLLVGISRKSMIYRPLGLTPRVPCRALLHSLLWR